MEVCSQLLRLGDAVGGEGGVGGDSSGGGGGGGCCVGACVRVDGPVEAEAVAGQVDCC